MPKTTLNFVLSKALSLSDIERKLCMADQLQERLLHLPRPLVFTNGVFDVVHRGHVMYLEQARALGGSLIVALNTDASARRLGKGPDRPLNHELDRACVMAALSSTSLVTWFDEDTPVQLMLGVRPDIYVKGGDYDMAQLAETRWVESWGGHAVALPFVSGYSTTALVRKIRDNAH
jgi:rfaE bifunctional protein nucleotidyltransferase chain/domain